MKLRKMIRRRRFNLSSLLIASLLAIAIAPVSSTTTYAAQRRQPTRRAPTTQKQAPLTVYGQGYKKGYGDGFAQGQADWQQGAPRDYRNSNAYQQRDRQYDSRYVWTEEYIQGYELGFELGHTDGYYGRANNPVEPANAAVLAKAAALADAQRERERQAAERDRQMAERERQTSDQSQMRRDTPSSDAPVNVAPDTEMQLRLNSSINTQNNRVGDRFTAVVVTPSTYEGATIEGHIAVLNKSGRVTGRTELGLAFDTIILKDGRRGRLDAELQRIVDSESVKKVDEEGRVETGSRSRDSQVRGGAGAAAGAVIGGIVGGVKGAVLGAIIGGAAGVGTVYVEGNKDLVLDPGTEMVIRTLKSSSR